MKKHVARPLGAKRFVVAENNRLTCVNAYGQSEEWKATVLVRKDRGVLVLVDAADCVVEPEIFEALKRGVTLQFDTGLLDWIS